MPHAEALWGLSKGFLAKPENKLCGFTPSNAVKTKCMITVNFTENLERVTQILYISWLSLQEIVDTLTVSCITSTKTRWVDSSSRLDVLSLSLPVMPSDVLVNSYHLSDHIFCKFVRLILHFVLESG